MDPYRDELFWASVGGGAYLNGDRGIAHVLYFRLFLAIFCICGPLPGKESNANLRLLHE